MAEFEALNELRSQTLRQIRAMVSEEGALWDRSFDGQNTSGMLADLERSRARFRALWVRHESIRQQMVVHECSLLVIPDHHHRGNILDNKAFCDWLADQARMGHEIVIHG